MLLRKQVFYLKNRKLSRASTTIDFNDFFLNFFKFRTIFLLTHVYKVVRDFLLFFLRSWIICPKQKKPGLFTLTKQSISITRDLSKIKKNKKIPNTFLQTLLSAMQNFRKKILNSMVVGARQSFQFFRQVIWFLGNYRTLSKFKYWILHSGPGKYNTW